jgi:hypothetical protein
VSLCVPALPPSAAVIRLTAGPDRRSEAGPRAAVDIAIRRASTLPGMHHLISLRP